MTVGSKKRDVLIDAMKGLAILLVILGHLLQNRPGFDNDLWYRVIYSFHMPLFMFLAGFTAFFSKGLDSWAGLRKKFLMLVVPFLAWYGLRFFIHDYQTISAAQYWIRLAKSPDWGLWFLWVLFLDFSALAVVLRLEKYIGTLAYALPFWLFMTVHFKYLGLPLLALHFPYFFAGYVVSRYKARLLGWWQPIAWMSLVVFPLAVWFWYRDADPSFAPALATAIHNLHLPFVYRLLLDSYGLVVPFAGIALTFAVVGWLTRRFALLGSWLAWLGLYSLDIYVIHFNFLAFTKVGSPLEIAVSLMAVLLVTLGLSILILRPIPPLNFLLLGGRTSHIQLQFKSWLPRLARPFKTRLKSVILSFRIS